MQRDNTNKPEKSQHLDSLVSEYIQSCTSIILAKCSPSSAAMTDRDSKRRKLTTALAFTSHRNLQRLRKLLDAKEDAAPGRSHGYGWRASEAVLEKAMNCYEKVSLPSTESDHVHFYIGKIEPMLQYILCESKCYKESFDIAFSSHDTLELLLYVDETTGGNVLATASSKQFYFVHVAIKQIGHLRLEEAWLPFAAIPARDLKLIRGQLSAVMALICRSIDQQDRQGVCVGEKKLEPSCSLWLQTMMQLRKPSLPRAQQVSNLAASAKISS